MAGRSGYVTIIGDKLMVHDLEQKINQLHRTPSDMNEHFPTIIKYGSEEGVNHITEMGCRGVCSTWGWLACAPENGFISYDLYHPSHWKPETNMGIDGGQELQSVYDTADAYGLKFDFIQADVLKIDIEPTDLLFIDTWHCYDQLVAELKRHSDKVKKYLCFHDTTTYAHRSEPSTSENSFEGGLTEGKGLWDAVTEFLNDNSDKWELVERYENNNGFTIIKRIGS